LNVVSLFTNIPLDIAIDCVNDNWNFILKKFDLPKTEFLMAVRFNLDSTYFTFNNIIHKQNFGTPILHLSSIIADLVKQKLERIFLLSIISFFFIIFILTDWAYPDWTRNY